MITEGKENEKGIIRFIDSKWLQSKTERKRNDDEHDNGMIVESYYRSLDSNPDPNKYSPNSIEFELSSLLLNSILERNQKFKKPDLQKWARHIDLAIRRDKRTAVELEAVIRWCQADAFWQNNILSTKTLRTQFDKLWMQMKGKKDHGRLGEPKSNKYGNTGTTINVDQ